VLNNGDLIRIDGDIHLWHQVELDEKDTVRYFVRKTLGTILYSHHTEPDWYYIFLHKPIDLTGSPWRENCAMIWTGWVYLNWQRYEQGNFEVIAANQ